MSLCEDAVTCLQPLHGLSSACAALCWLGFRLTILLFQLRLFSLLRESIRFETSLSFLLRLLPFTRFRQGRIDCALHTLDIAQATKTLRQESYAGVATQPLKWSHLVPSVLSFTIAR